MQDSQRRCVPNGSTKNSLIEPFNQAMLHTLIVVFGASNQHLEPFALLDAGRAGR